MELQMRFSAGFITLAIALPLMASAAHADGDAEKGKVVFKKCMACHDAVNEKNKVGPHLVGIVGRPAGSVESFQKKYSKAMKEAGENGLIWDEANISEYLVDPKGKIPGNKMVFPGLKKEDDIANVIAYLKADPKP